jgi:hypothetical protein
MQIFANNAEMIAFRRFRPSAAESAANRRFQFHKRSQLFIRANNEALSVAKIALESPMIGR